MRWRIGLLEDVKEMERWFVAHTKPRCEKKLKLWCDSKSIINSLPTYPSAHKYRGKEVTFHKPLFPGYLFISTYVSERQKILSSNYVANLLEPPDQEEFAAQLSDIQLAVETMDNIRVVPNINAGTKVLIQRGPLAGLEAWVEGRAGPREVFLRLDFIGQAAAVSVAVEDLELV